MSTAVQAYRATMAQAEELLKAKEPFSAGSLTAERHDLLYVVKSYGVLIAEDRYYNAYVFTDAYTHSKTTSKHANMVKRAWGLQ
jgi:hypothetical protein